MEVIVLFLFIPIFSSFQAHQRESVNRKRTKMTEKYVSELLQLIRIFNYVDQNVSSLMHHNAIFFVTSQRLLRIIARRNILSIDKSQKTWKFLKKIMH